MEKNKQMERWRLILGDETEKDFSDYCSVAKEYGTMEDMERLISEADKRNDPVY